MSSSRKLEIGPGPTPLEGFDTVNMHEPATYVCRWGFGKFPVPSNYYEFVFASHVLEHVPWNRTQMALSEVYRILQKGGSFEVWVPDFAYIIDCYHKNVCGDKWRRYNPTENPMTWVNGRIFTYGPGDDNWHHACFDESYLKKCLKEAGFKGITRIGKRTLGDSHGPIDMGMKGIKP
jgi:predicted SAM-dependent methyltransferase